MSTKKVHFGRLVTKPTTNWKMRTRKKIRRMKCEMCLTMNPKNAIKCRVCGIRITRPAPYIEPNHPISQIPTHRFREWFDRSAHATMVSKKDR